eukprot:4826068-Pyramimonas_sp.AAC.1
MTAWNFCSACRSGGSGDTLCRAIGQRVAPPRGKKAGESSAWMLGNWDVDIGYERATTYVHVRPLRS